MESNKQLEERVKVLESELKALKEQVEVLRRASQPVGIVVDDVVGELKKCLPLALWFGNDGALDIYVKAIKEGLLNKDVEGYRWRKDMSKAVLAYLFGRLYCGDVWVERCMGGGYRFEIKCAEWQRGKRVKLPQREIQQAFGIERISRERDRLVAKLERMHKPNGYEVIDMLFA